MWLNDICRHLSLPYLVLQESVAASPLAPQWVLLYHQLVSPFSRNEVLSTACWSSCCREWGKHLWYILKWSLSDSYYHVSHIQLLCLCCSLLHEFLFTFLSVYCTLNSYVATIHRRTMGTGRQWMTGMQKGFFWFFPPPPPLFFYFSFLKTTLASHHMKKSILHQLLPSASVRLCKALWEVVWGKVASKQHIELHLFPPYQKRQKMPSSLFYPDLT